MDEFIKLGYLAEATRFRRISDKLYLDGNKLYEQASVRFKASWFSVYYALSIAKAPLMVSDLARIIGFSHITVKNIVREMDAEHLVQVRPDAMDRRAKCITLSEYGKNQSPRLNALWGAFLRCHPNHPARGTSGYIEHTGSHRQKDERIAYLYG